MLYCTCVIIYFGKMRALCSEASVLREKGRQKSPCILRASESSGVPNHEMGVGQGYVFADVCAGIIACVL